MTSAVLAAAGYREGPPAPAADARLVIAGTSDLHGFVRSWDYDADRPDPGVGLTKVATLVRELRRHHGGDDRVILLDAGDTIQGTPMMRLAADGRLDGPHPMALAMRELGYSAAALGNHDVEYGFDVLDAFTSGCGFPVLAANTTGPRALGASVLLDVLPQPLPASEPPVVGGSWPTLRLGVIGLTTPGIPVWTKGVVDGLLDVGDLVAAAATEADRLLKAGADLIVVTAHSGPCPFSSYGRVVPWLENASALVAEQVPGVVAVLAGHAHSDVAEQLIARPDGSVAVLTEPACYGRRLSVIHVDVAFDGSRWRAVGTSAQTLDPHEADEDEVVAAAVEGPHLATRALLAERVGGLSEPVDLSVPPWRPSVALELIARVAGEAAIDGAALDRAARDTGRRRVGVEGVPGRIAAGGTVDRRRRRFAVPVRQPAGRRPPHWRATAGLPHLVGSVLRFLLGPRYGPGRARPTRRPGRAAGLARLRLRRRRGDRLRGDVRRRRRRGSGRQDPEVRRRWRAGRRRRRVRRRPHRVPAQRQS